MYPGSETGGEATESYIPPPNSTALSAMSYEFGLDHSGEANWQERIVGSATGMAELAEEQAGTRASADNSAESLYYQCSPQ